MVEKSAWSYGDDVLDTIIAVTSSSYRHYYSISRASRKSTRDYCKFVEIIL
jgi:hypothetical protein